jgi:hypothetical protein
MSDTIAIVSSSISRESDRSLASLAEFVGLTPTMVASPAEAASSGCAAAAMHSSVIAQALHHGRYPDEEVDAIFGGLKAAFVYGFPLGSRDGTAHALTGKAFSGVTEIGFPGVEYRFADDRVCRQLGGFSFQTGWDEKNRTFDEVKVNDSITTLISANERPYLARINRGGCEVFLCAGANIADVDAFATPDDLRLDILPSLAPFLMFLKHACAGACWENPHPRATLIIDDPLLRQRYGFLDHEKLLASLESHGFAATIAFIPWNYRRSSPRIAEMFSQHSDRLSICVHGCDHTGAEFGDTNEAVLRNKAGIALERVRLHEQLTGLSAEPIMVFPQGVFSRAALPALQTGGFLAAVNSELFPCDAHQQELKLRDLLSVAIETDGFPLFGRRYPKSLLGFAVDLFLGKPALIAAHHDNFRCGYSQISSFAGKLKTIEPELRWAPLQQTLESTALYRRTSRTQAQVRSFTDNLRLSNPYGERVTFHVRRNVGSNIPVREILVDGLPTRHEIAANCLCVDVTLDAGASTSVKLVRRTAPDTHPMGVARYDVLVAAQRLLSEFRDNYLASNNALLRFSRTAARIISH